MSDESISGHEDTENLLYIAKGIHVEELSLGEDHVYVRESIASSSSRFSEGKIGSDIELLSKISKDLGPETFNDPDIIARTRPFELKWAFGMNSKIPIKNLTNDTDHKFIFSAGHFPIIYDYCQNTMEKLEGHYIFIKYLACSANGRWIVTVGGTAQGNVMVWDRSQEKVSCVCTIFEPYYPNQGVEILEISGSARYLIMIGAVSESEYSIDFWLWTEGHEKPNDSFKVAQTYGRPVAVCFNPDIEEHIMIIFEHQVFNMVWDKETKKLSNVLQPQILHKSKVGVLSCGTYIRKCHQCFVGSNNGCIAIFGNTLYSKPYEEGELDNNKIFQSLLKVSPGSIHCCTTTDDLVVTADSEGVIQFFDRTIRIVYWLKDFNLGPIYSISFNLTSKMTKQGADKYVIRQPISEPIIPCEFNDITTELRLLSKNDLPESATLGREPFYVRDFLVATASSNVYVIKCIENICTPLFLTAEGDVTAIETHDEQNYLLIGYASGTILLIDYETYIPISKFILPVVDDGKNAVTCLKYSPESLHLVCGRQNGEIWILEPILLIPKEKSFNITGNVVKKIDFSNNPLQFAYYDLNRTVVIFTYDSESCKWSPSGKVRAHYDEITDMMFMPGAPHSKLYTISKDRHIVEYKNIGIEDGKLDVNSTDRIDQTAFPMCFTYWYQTSSEKQRSYILVSDSQYKLKFLYQSTKIPRTVILGPAYGCFKDDCIRKMLIVPGCESRYMVFSTTKYLGLHLLPPDGNPYKFVGYLGHSDDIAGVQLSYDGKYVFSFAENNAFVFKWEIRTRAVEVMAVLGGKELEPFYCLIEGGATGSLVQEMKDLFYYMQIVQQENMDVPRRVLDTISVNEIPDLVRACGFYPSEFELENLMIDIRYRNFDETEKTNEEISFIDFVKLYCNHKPAYGYSLKEIEDAFNLLAANAEDFVDTKMLTREELITQLSHTGEPLSANSAFKCFKTLLRNSEIDESFSFLPETMTFEFFRDEVLGVDMLRDKFHEVDGSVGSLDVSIDDMYGKKNE